MDSQDLAADELRIIEKDPSKAINTLTAQTLKHKIVSPALEQDNANGRESGNLAINFNQGLSFD